MVSAGNDDDLMSQVFASVQLPEVKWTTETNQSHEVIHKTVTVNENGEQQIHTERYHYDHNGGGHDSDDDDDQHHRNNAEQQQHSDNQGYHKNSADEDMVSQVFFSRPTGDTFRVENGVPSSDNASERSSSRRHSHNSHHSHHSRHMSESGSHHEHDNGFMNKKILESVPNKTLQQDSLIAELKKQHSGLDDTSDDETLKDDDDDDHTVNGHEEMWHHEPHEEQIHVAHYDVPPQEPPRDYESDRHSIAPSESIHHHQDHDNYFGQNTFNNHDQRSQRSNSIHSEASRHSIHAPPSHHSSHDSIPAHPPPPIPIPQPRDSRASSTSTLRSDRDIRIVTNHNAPAPPPQNPPPRIFGHDYDNDENSRRPDPKGIHTYREYGTDGNRRRSDASERSSVGYHRESFTVGDIEYIQEKPRAPQRERTATKQSTVSYNLPPQKENNNNRMRTDTKQSVVSQRSAAFNHQNYQNIPAKRTTSVSKQQQHMAPATPFVPNVDDSSIAPVSHLFDQFGGRSQGNRHLFFPKKPEPIVEHHFRTSSKRGSDVSSVHSLKHIENKHPRSGTHQSAVSHASQHSHKRRESTDSVGTQHTAVVEKNPGKYDSIRVVKNVKSYKQFLDVWSQREIDEEAAEEGPIHAEPIPRPRYSISARHVYPDFNSLKVTQKPKHRPSLRPSEKLNEFSLPGKVDKATSYTNLSVIGTETRRSTFVPIQEEDEVADGHHNSMNGGTHISPQRSRNSTLKHVVEQEQHHEDEIHNAHHHHHGDHDDDEYDVDISQLRSMFEHGKNQQRSRRASMQSNISTKSLGPIPIVPASHRHAIDNGLSLSSRRRHHRH